MILKFGGSALPSGIGVLGWTVSTPSLSARTVDIPGVRGRTRTGGKLGNRSVTLRMVLLGDTAAENIAALDALNGWCYAEEPQELYLPGREDRYLLAECDGYAPPDIGKSGDEFEISFICHVPDYIGAEERSAQNIANVSGTISTPVRIEQTLSATLTDPVWLIDATAHSIRLSGDVDAGELVIDSEKGTITLDGMDISDQATLDSDLYFMLAPGAHTIVGPSGLDVTAYWRDRWI